MFSESEFDTDLTNTERELEIGKRCKLFLDLALLFLDLALLFLDLALLFLDLALLFLDLALLTK